MIMTTTRYPAEMFPVKVRAPGNTITTFTNWTVNLIFAQFSPGALTAIGSLYFYVYFVFNIIALLCYMFFYPETKVSRLTSPLWMNLANRGSGTYSRTDGCALG